MSLIKIAIVFIISGLIEQKTFAQEREIRKILVFGVPAFTIADNNIYEDSIINPQKLVATIRENRIYKGYSSDNKDVLYSFANGKVYRTAVVNQKTLLCYIKDKDVFLRTKKGDFEMCGSLSPSNQGRITVFSYLEPMEVIALNMAAKIWDAIPSK